MKFSDITNIRIDEFRLPNSLTLYYHQDHSNPIICLQLYIRSGSASETSRHYGYAHFLEHLVFKRTAKYRDNQISNLASAKGMVLNAYTDFDATCYYLMLPREELALGMDILAQMAFHANFSEADILTEKDIIIEEINQYDSDPEMSFIEHIQATYFRRSPLSHPVLGSHQSVSSATLGKLKSFYQKHYRPSNAFLVASGDIDRSELLKIFSAAFSSWMDKPFSQLAVKCAWRRQHLLESRIKQGQDLIALALPELPETHPDSEALHIAIRHLAIGKSSLLHKELVETRKLCSYVKVSSVSGLIPGISVILIAPTQARHKKRILDTIMAHLETILHHGVPDSAMQLVKKDILHSWLYSFDGVEHKADLIAAEVFNNDLSRIRSYGDLVQAIDNDLVISAVNRHWSPSTWAVYHQGPAVFNYTPGKPVRLHPEVGKEYDHPMMNGSTVEVTLGKSEISEFHHFVLPGGMKVVYNYVPSRPICGFALSSPLCQLNEKIPGQNYFSGALCLYGTRKHSHAELMRISRDKGLNIRVQHHLDSTLFRGKCYAQDLPDALSLLNEIVNEPVFEEHYLDMLKSAALDSIRREMDFPASLAYNRWFGSVFGRNNNLLRATGEPADIKALTLADCLSWHESWHLGRDFSLCIVGSIEPNMLKELCVRFFSCSATDDP
ncbi:MAG TPA: insulinase family protein, partial [Candidatus Cloacimonadota bacterium]|nr:insulinase family protein [Candidatus Cloacimonadota bacterium]